MEVFTIVVESGPVGGKTSLIPIFAERIEEKYGFRPEIIPEAATLLEEYGIHPKHIDNMSNEVFQNLVSGVTMSEWRQAILNCTYRIEEFGGKMPIALKDRGMIGQKVYCDLLGGDFEKLMALHCPPEWRKRYQQGLVIHPQSPAVDAPEIYLKYVGDNPARGTHETVEYASDLCLRLKGAWEAEPGVTVITIPNRTDNFNDKVNEAWSKVDAHLEALYRA